MPHHAAALGGGFARTQPLDNLAGSAELLIAAHHLHPWAAVGVHEHGAGAQDLQQVGLVQHPGDQLLLGIQAFERGIVSGMERLPGIEMLFARGDGAVVGFQATAAHQHQAAVKQSGLAFLQARGFGFLAAAHVALQLHKGFLHRVGAGFRTLLALHHHQRDAVHEQHNVRDDEGLHAARRVDTELVDSVELVVRRVVKIDQAHHRVSLAGQLVAVGLRLEQHRLHGLVGLQQGAVRVAQQLAAQVF